MGLALFVGFWIVFVILMSPVFQGKNVLDFMDNLFNTISKESSYFIPAVMKKTAPFAGQTVSFAVKADNEAQADRISKLFKAGAAETTVDGKNVKVTGDLGLILKNILEDSDAMFSNNSSALEQKYGVSGRQVLYDWWAATKSADKDLKKQEKFKEATIILQVQAKAIEPSYNYYGIKSESIKKQIVVVVISLAGYVIYTLWYGFAILFMFEGWGMKLEH